MDEIKPTLKTKDYRWVLESTNYTTLYPASPTMFVRD
jgi:hypothetical protein